MNAFKKSFVINGLADQVTQSAVAVSSGKEFRIVRGSARDVDPLEYGARFPRLWRAFLHAHHRGPVEVAYMYGVTEKAAEKWWNGIGGPNGAKVGLAFQLNPEGAAQFLGRAA